MTVNFGLAEELIAALLKRYVDEGIVNRLEAVWCLSRNGFMLLLVSFALRTFTT